ncbi:DnaJ-domain-containing protein [Athelia psychrophila]|uniref:DnaJ-domain-containing protein n=1 Tax=Athelia psychrophila TaxID=1759441 RepID=A0A166VQS9_9AGAM|nr:DnaJ-domain-containing protein [Fibularhizoctonia sp. CBS 109695]
MKLFFLAAFLALLVTVVSAWEKEDHEIFDLVSELQASEGKGTTFYSFIGVPSTATLAQINKAYRKKSMELHPDKNPDVKGIQERFARLGIIATMLRTTEGRTRYDHFYKNGVPRWRGTGYYYSRWRPGMIEVSVFLISFTSLLQYIVQHMTYKIDIERIEKIIGEAKSAAWGPKMIPVQGSRKLKMTLANPSTDSEGKRTPAKTIDIKVDGDGTVSIPDDNGEFHPLDATSATPASIGRTWPIALVRNLYASVTNRARPTPTETPAEVNEDTTESYETESSAPGSGTATPIDGGAPKAGRAPAVKAGGVRRGNVRKRA